MTDPAQREPLERRSGQYIPLRHDRKPRSWSEVAVEAIIASLLIFSVVILCYRGFNPKITDFRMFYSTAEMIRHGDAHHLYDLTEQHAFQIRFTGRIGLIFVYPAATALLYLPGTLFTIDGAYLLWTIASVLILALTCLILNAALGLFRHPTVLFAVTLLFVPVWLNLMHGQVIMVLLLAYSIALYYMLQGKEFVAGLALALALVKFHLVLPFVFVLLLRKRWSAITGFVVGSAGFLGLCVALVGWQFPIDYVRFVLQMPSMPLVGLHPSGMANLRGLLFGLLHHDPPVSLIGAISLALVVWVTRAWHHTDLGFAITIVATILVSYHQNPQDLSLLLISFAVMIKHLRWLRWKSLTLVFFAPPLPLLLLGPHFWMLGFGVLILLVVLIRTETVERSREVPVLAGAAR